MDDWGASEVVPLFNLYEMKIFPHQKKLESKWWHRAAKILFVGFVIYMFISNISNTYSQIDSNHFRAWQRSEREYQIMWPKISGGFAALLDEASADYFSESAAEQSLRLLSEREATQEELKTVKAAFSGCKRLRADCSDEAQGSIKEIFDKYDNRPLYNQSFLLIVQQSGEAALMSALLVLAYISLIYVVYWQILMYIIYGYDK